MSAEIAPPEAVAMVPAHGARQWQELAAALARRGPAPCEGGVLPVETWWATSPGSVTLAIAACGLCPVVVECRAYALAAGEREGVWGALRPSERGL